MADELVFDDGEGNGVGTLNSGDSGSNDTATSTDSNAGQGGGAGPTSTTQSSGSNNIPPSTNLEVINNAIVTYLSISSMVPSYDDIVPLYVDNKLGFKDLKERAKKNNPDQDSEEVEKKVDEVRAETIKYFKEGAGREELENKYNELKSAVTNSVKSIKQLPTNIAQAVAESVMPPVLGPIGPNPASWVLKSYNHFVRIKRVIDTILVSMLGVITAVKLLGLQDEDWVNKIIDPVASPLKAIQEQLNSKEKEFEDEANKDNDGYIDQDPTGDIISGKEIKELAASTYKIYGEWPLSGDAKKIVRKMKKGKSPYTEEDEEYGEMFWDYHKWLIATKS